MKITLFYNAKILVYNDTLPYRGNSKCTDIDIKCKNNMTSSADMTGICVADENCLSHGYFVDAMIVADKKILKLGDEKSLRTFLKSDGFKACAKSENLDYCEINLGGRFVMPGFVDCHEHPILLSHCLEEISCLPPNVTSIEELKSRVA